MKRLCIFCLYFGLVLFGSTIPTAGQAETLTNNEIILMTRAGLSKELILRKIRDSNGKFETTVQGLIELKKSGVADAVIALMFEKSSSGSTDPKQTIADFSVGSAESNSPATDRPHIILEPKEALLNAKTVAIEKSSIHPSRQALEKELAKRNDWKELNLIVIRYKESADLHIEIGRVPFSWITHRYV